MTTHFIFKHWKCPAKESSSRSKKTIFAWRAIRANIPLRYLLTAMVRLSNTPPMATKYCGCALRTTSHCRSISPIWRTIAHERPQRNRRLNIEDYPLNIRWIPSNNWPFQSESKLQKFIELKVLLYLHVNLPYISIMIASGSIVSLFLRFLFHLHLKSHPALLEQ